MIYKPFKQQTEFLLNDSRIRCLFAAKRSGKSEICYIDLIQKLEERQGYDTESHDPYMIVMVAPTDQMLKKLSWPKFFQFAKGFNPEFNKSENRCNWHNGAILYGISAEKIQRMEGLKLNHIFMDEAFQMKDEVFYESLARVSDTRGTIVIAGSLGTNIVNPKNHWLHTVFIENEFEDARVWEWATSDNPHFPKAELDRMKNNLDPRTYRMLFEIDWNVPGTNLVYEDFEDDNLDLLNYDRSLETVVSIDWGWAHPMAALFFQYDRRHDTVYLFDEIVMSKLKLEQLIKKILQKKYKIDHWVCDIAGNQEREQTGHSNMEWFKQNFGIRFKYRRTAVNYGIPIVRSYIKNAVGQRKFIVDGKKCPKSVDGLRNYSYAEKNGQIENENPIKKDDDTADAIRYYFVNMRDKQRAAKTIKEFDRWGKWQFN